MAPPTLTTVDDVLDETQFRDYGTWYQQDEASTKVEEDRVCLWCDRPLSDPPADKRP